MNLITCFKRVWRDVFHSERGSFVAFSTAVATAVGSGVAAASTTAAVAAGTAAATTAATAGITAGELALGAAAIGGGVAAYGAYQQGQAQKNMMNYQAQAAAVQQQIVKQTAAANITGVQEQASLQSTQLARTQATVVGAQKAAEGGQGIDGSGTAADIAKDTFTKQQLDQMTLQYNANVKAWGITNQANAQLWGLGAQEGQYEMGAENAQTAGDISAASSLLSSASQIATEAYRFQNPTPFG